MSDSTINSSCASCSESIFCPTWGEWKCKVHKRRFYGPNIPTECKAYKKRGKNFVESPCQCEDCLKNPELVEDQEEQ